MGKTSKRTWGRSGLLTQWIIKYGYLPIILIGMVGLALDIGTREWKSDDVIVADAPVVAAPSVVAEAPVVAETFVERQPPTVEIKVEPKPTMQLTAPVMAEDLVEPPPPTMKTKVEAKPTQLAALNPDVRLPEESDQPASKGYIMYANLPTNWTPLPLPDGISSASTPHTDNIRAEIEQAAKLFDVDIQMMKAFAKIESGYNPKAKTGSYKCLFQLSNQEFAKYWQGNIYDIRDCSVAAARKFATEAAQFEKDVGRRATAAELYCIHQQGYEGCSFHYDAPQQLAWKNMYLTTEGQEKGAKWARKAIWGNVPWDLKKTIKGGVEALTSGQFIALWTERVNRFIARKVEPPTSYVQHASKAKKPTRSATTDKKKAKVAASAKKMTKLEAR
ncbi:MAG: hypothetical protein WCB55_01675 [Pseudolabrys sp.]|jgi:hypothetical protein